MITKNSSTLIPRPPIVTVMGHIDHGKSTLLDYIRKSNVAEQEVGGITQHLSAYEVVHVTKDGESKKITFLDTPGHEAFAAMRSRGARVADVAILVVSAEDGVKEQTLEALVCIKESSLPFVVAITKIDKPGASVEKTKQSLAEAGVYLEGFGGNISFMGVSSKSGEGISELLDLVVLAGELEEISGDPNAPAGGVCIESHIDAKRGTSATLIITNGTLERGMYIVAGNAIAPTRLIENFLGVSIENATFSSPVRVVGFSKLPPIGSQFHSYSTKKKAEDTLKQEKAQAQSEGEQAVNYEERVIIPIIIKSDVLGTAEAVEHEIEKEAAVREKIYPKAILKDVGNINERDILLARGSQNALIAGFNVGIDPTAREKAEREGVHFGTFNVIYDLAEWLKGELRKRTPKVVVEDKIGLAKILRTFSRTMDKQIVGGEVLEGTISAGAPFKILRRDVEIGRGKILGLEQQKAASKRVEAGNQFGLQSESKIEIAPGDRIEVFERKET